MQFSVIPYVARKFKLTQKRTYTSSDLMTDLIAATAHVQCWGKLLLKVMHYNIALLPKKGLQKGYKKILRYIINFQIKSLLLSHHHSTSALVSEILDSVLQN